MNKLNKGEIIEVIKKIAVLLNTNKINYIIGSSCSLLLHGIDVLPNDLDIVVDPSDLNKVKLLLKSYFQNNRLDIDGLECEISPRPINKDLTIDIYIDSLPIKVHKLEHEYKYYKQREDQSEKVKIRIKLIGEKLDY